jgi:hypothetical protein
LRGLKKTPDPFTRALESWRSLVQCLLARLAPLAGTSVRNDSEEGRTFRGGFSDGMSDSRPTRASLAMHLHRIQRAKEEMISQGGSGEAHKMRDDENQSDSGDAHNDMAPE